jgi:mono/diheme cytochrome c family protein
MRRHSIGLLFAGFAALFATAGRAADDLGLELYATHCAACHGADGKGDPATERILAVDVGDLSSLAEANGGEFPVEYVRRIVDGRDGPGPHVVKGKPMPAWGRLLQEGDTAESREAVAAARIDALVGHVRGMQDPPGR